MMESTSTVSWTYGLFTDDVRWQMVCFSCGAADANEGQVSSSSSTPMASPAATTPRTVRRVHRLLRFAPTRHPPRHEHDRAQLSTRGILQCPAGDDQCQRCPDDP